METRYTNRNPLSSGTHALTMRDVQNVHDRHKRKAYKRKEDTWSVGAQTLHSICHKKQRTALVDTLPTSELWLPGSRSRLNCHLIKGLAAGTFVLKSPVPIAVHEI